MGIDQANYTNKKLIFLVKSNGRTLSDTSVFYNVCPGSQRDIYKIDDIPEIGDEKDPEDLEIFRKQVEKSWKKNKIVEMFRAQEFMSPDQLSQNIQSWLENYNILLQNEWLNMQDPEYREDDSLKHKMSQFVESDQLKEREKQIHSLWQKFENSMSQANSAIYYNLFWLIKELHDNYQSISDYSKVIENKILRTLYRNQYKSSQDESWNQNTELDNLSLEQKQNFIKSFQKLMADLKIDPKMSLEEMLERFAQYYCEEYLKPQNEFVKYLYNINQLGKLALGKQELSEQNQMPGEYQQFSQRDIFQGSKHSFLDHINPEQRTNAFSNREEPIQKQPDWNPRQEEPNSADPSPRNH